MSRDKRDAEQAARRAKRLAERAEERARRKERQAERAAERADRLAERVKRRPERESDLNQSIEDMVDEVTQKAEQWIDEQTRRLFDSDDEREIKRAETQAAQARKEAEKARQSADRAGRTAEELSDHKASRENPGKDPRKRKTAESASGDIYHQARQPKRRKSGRRRTYESDEHHGFGWVYYEWPKKSRSEARKRRTAHLYRDRQRKKLCGVCAGVAAYFGRPVWEIRLYAILGLIFIPSVTIPTYFIAYFLMDDKPLYRRVTDRFDEDLETSDAGEAGDGSGFGRNDRNRRRAGMADQEPVMSNVQAMKTAKDKFADIEQRLRQMESHVTSSRFELQRELKKISGED